MTSNWAFTEDQDSRANSRFMATAISAALQCGFSIATAATSPPPLRILKYHQGIRLFEGTRLYQGLKLYFTEVYTSASRDEYVWSEIERE